MDAKRVRHIVLASIVCVGGAIPLGAQRVAVGSVSESVPSPRSITLQMENIPLDRAIRLIAQQAGMQLCVLGDIVPQSKFVSVQLRGATANEAFVSVLKGTGLKVSIVSNVVTLSLDAGTVLTEQGGISGKVVDAKTRQGLRGATISLSGSNTTGSASKSVSGSATTREDGTFRMSGIVPGTYTVHVRLLGYVKTSKAVIVADDQTASVEIALEPSVNALDQVVVTGTIVATAQRELPNAMTVITAKDIEQRGITQIDQLFRGDVPGLFAANFGSDNPMDSVIMFSRGGTALREIGTAASNPIKTYVDGVELANAAYLSQIDPKSIERIEIISGPQASTIYGSNAINGVMQIFTKRGTTPRPQLTVSLLSGLIQNDFRPNLTPQHDYSAQVTGQEGRWSYTGGGSWNYVGPWTPGKQTARTGGFGGGRMQIGSVTSDVSLRLSTTKTRRRGDAGQPVTAKQESGFSTPTWRNGHLITPQPTDYTLQGQTLSASFGWAPTSWMSHEATVGRDVNAMQTIAIAPAFLQPAGGDTLLALTTNDAARTSLRYAMTTRIPVTSVLQAVVVAGVDEWHTTGSGLSTRPVALTGTLTGSPSVSRTHEHNVGGFVQGQFGLLDAVFVTYGLRAEWNPNYGAAAQPNLAPRYGIAYTREITTPLGPLTTKLRASYGRSTRPPQSGQKSAELAPSSEWNAYGRYESQKANPDLGPEFQQGGEGGIDLYFGSRGSLIITRYNQTVDDLIASPAVDSVDYLPELRQQYGLGEWEPGYNRKQYQNLNIGSIRNQGWELQSTINTGPVTTRGTYSWTKSRVIGIAQRYRALLTGAQYQQGASFNFLPEHTWALGVTYAHAATSITFNLNGTGFMYRRVDGVTNAVASNIRILPDRLRMQLPLNWRPLGSGYTKADLNLVHRFMPAVEGLVQIQNLSNFYQSDYSPSVATIGRQSKAGFRVRW